MAFVVFAMLLVWLGICLSLTFVAARAMRHPRRALPTIIPLEAMPDQPHSA
jgi:hypothetical protein